MVGFESKSSCTQSAFMEVFVKKTYKNFEWVVVDDGSTDNTEALLNKYIEEADFPIRYRWKSNGGSIQLLMKAFDKHRAVFFNNGL
jgi:glycosyltransferase involved in cell wall biosynthesis